MADAFHAFSGDGQHYAYWKADTGLHVWSVEGGNPPVTMAPAFRKSRAPTFAIAGDGLLLATIDEPATDAPWRALSQNARKSCF